MPGKRPPWKDIPDKQLVPAGGYEFVVKELAETESKATDTEKAKLMYVATLKVHEPKEYRGALLPDRFVIGTNEDPEGDDPETWKASKAATRLKVFLRACKTDLGDDMDDTMENVEGHHVVGMVRVDPARDDPKTGRNYGEGNSISAYYEVGAPGVSVGVARAASPPSAAAPRRAPAAPKAAPVATETDGASAPKASKPAKLEVTTCPICGDTQVPRTGFIQHVNQHSSGEEAEE